MKPRKFAANRHGATVIATEMQKDRGGARRSNRRNVLVAKGKGGESKARASCSQLRWPCASIEIEMQGGL